MSTWAYSTIHNSACQVIEEQTLWGQTVCRIWLPTQDAVVRVARAALRPLTVALNPTLEVHRIGYVAAAAKVAEVLDGSNTADGPVLLAPMASNVIPLPHQLRALARAIAGDRVRYLLADEVGLGKTIEGGLIMRELKLRGLTEKFLLRECGRRWLPQKIWARPKRPYRAPIHRSFCQDGKFPDYVREACSPERLREAGFFDPGAVGQLLGRIAQGAAVGETDDMALAGIISTQLLHRSFIRDFSAAPPLGPHDNVKVRGELPS